MKQTRFTPAEVVAAAEAILDNLDWDVEAQEGKGPKEIAAMQEALDFGDDPETYAANNWADDDGMIEIGKGFSDIYDFLYEFASVTAANAI